MTAKKLNAPKIITATGIPIIAASFLMDIGALVGDFGMAVAMLGAAIKQT